MPKRRRWCAQLAVCTMSVSYWSIQVTIMKRGAAPVDPCSGYICQFFERFFSLSIDYEDFAVTHQVYVSSDGEVWDAMLNQTNIGKNANKCVIKMYPFFLT